MSIDYIPGQEAYPLLRKQKHAKSCAMCTQARLVSLSSRITETVTFINSTGHDAVVLWLSYTGDEVRVDQNLLTPCSPLCRLHVVGNCRPFVRFACLAACSLQTYCQWGVLGDSLYCFCSGSVLHDYRWRTCGSSLDTLSGRRSELSTCRFHADLQSRIVLTSRRSGIVSGAGTQFFYACMR